MFPIEDGRRAVSYLKSELLVTEATPVTEWALSGTMIDHVVGEILFPVHASPASSKVLVTPQYRLQIVQGFREG